MVETNDFVVIGAGLAGLAFAGAARTAGKTVVVLDKGRGVGGRTATRRLGDAARADHGAQYFTAKGGRFRAFVDAWLAEGENGGLAVWSRGFPRWRGGAIVPAEAGGHPRYAPVRGMSDLPKRLARWRGPLDVRTGTTVTALARGGGGGDGSWAVTAATSDGGEAAVSARAVVLALPPAQLLPLAGAFLPEGTRRQLASVTYDPCWALIARLDDDIPAEWPALDLSGEGGHTVLSFLSRDHSKRRNPAAPPVLVAHASGAWSRAHLEDAPREAAAALLDAVRGVVGPGMPRVAEAQAHRWRYALARDRFGGGSFWHPEIGLGGCGDWCDGGGKVEGALESGWRLGESVFGAEPEATTAT